MKKLKPIPHFANEAAEAAFWATHNTTEYFNYKKRVNIDFSNLRPSTQKVTLRFPKMLLAQLKKLANERDVPYQSLVKILLSEKIREENNQRA